MSQIALSPVSSPVYRQRFPGRTSRDLANWPTRALTALLRPRAHDLPQRGELAQVVGVVVADDHEAAQRGVAGGALEHGAQIAALVKADRLHRSQVRLETRDGLGEPSSV